MESKQNTCTPADEWSEFETWHEKKYPCDPLTGPSAALRWSGFQAARAAQGAGTAPVGATERTPIGYITIGDVEYTSEGAEIGGWDIDWDHKVIDAMEEFAVPEATYAVYLEPVPAPVSTAAAITASASVRTVVCSSATVYVCPERDIECGSRAANWCATCPKRIVPSRAADGQQGASK